MFIVHGQFFIEHIVGLSWDMSQIMRFSLQFQGFHRVSPSDCTMAPGGSRTPFRPPKGGEMLGHRAEYLLGLGLRPHAVVPWQR